MKGRLATVHNEDCNYNVEYFLAAKNSCERNANFSYIFPFMATINNSGY